MKKIMQLLQSKEKTAIEISVFKEFLKTEKAFKLMDKIGDHLGELHGMKTHQDITEQDLSNKKYILNKRIKNLFCLLPKEVFTESLLTQINSFPLDYDHKEGDYLLTIWMTNFIKEFVHYAETMIVPKLIPKMRDKIKMIHILYELKDQTNSLFAEFITPNKIIKAIFNRACAVALGEIKKQLKSEKADEIRFYQSYFALTKVSFAKKFLNEEQTNSKEKFLDLKSGEIYFNIDKAKVTTPVANDAVKNSKVSFSNVEYVRFNKGRSTSKVKEDIRKLKEHHEREFVPLFQ